MRQVQIDGQALYPSDVLRSYWHIAAERQRIYFARLMGSSAPWTADPILSTYRFTNAYRAADRVSQDLIQMAYRGSQSPDDLVLRVALYRFFNKPETWRLLESAVGEISVDNFDVTRYDAVLNAALDRRERIYSAAYIIPPPNFGADRKHRNHLLLLQHMLQTNLPEKVCEATSLRQMFEAIASYPSIGPFLGYQLAIDLNYTSLVNHDENDFVVAGPGALSGIQKCFPQSQNIRPESIIRWMVSTQQEQCEYYQVDFQNLFGRRLTMIDCQNLFCETDKYARVAYPHIPGRGKRTRIKQQYSISHKQTTPFFPPKWGLNDKVDRTVKVPLEDTLPRPDHAKRFRQQLLL